MRIFDIIENKKNKKELSSDEIKYFIENFTNNNIPDYQASALLMAIALNGMTDNETYYLTKYIASSGETVHFNKIKGIKADKHSTGGVGDKTSLIVAPIVASYGIKVAKMSGRGLGFTGGTIDKLESIPNFKTELTEIEFNEQVEKIGIAIIGQSKNLAPADKKLYALRDVTATIDSIPLIASSIMGKKLTADDDVIVLDVKTGSGAFMKTIEQSKELALAMVNIGKKANKKIMALITSMDQPLGNEIGNNREVVEAIDTLKNKGPKDLTELCVSLAANILCLSEVGNYEHCEKLAVDSLQNGLAYNYFEKMVISQGGDISYIKNTNKFEKTKYSFDVLSKDEGYVTRINTENYGKASLLLGAGRNEIGDKIDFSSGITVKAKLNDYIKNGDVLARLYTNNKNAIKEAEELILKAITITKNKIICTPIVLDKVL